MELQQTVQRGNSLLQRKEERLQELINTVAEEVRENISHHVFVGGAERRGFHAFWDKTWCASDHS